MKEDVTEKIPKISAKKTCTYTLYIREGENVSVCVLSIPVMQIL